MATRLYLLPFLAVGVAAQSTTPIDNDQVKVVVVNQAPHVKTKLHQHTVNRVMIYLQPGKQTIAYEDGQKVLLEWKAAEAKWSPAGKMHIAEITSDSPVKIVEVELKKAAGSGKPGGTLDPVKIDPKHYKVEFENPQVRVLRVRIGAHESAPMHEHMLNRVVTYITDQRVKITGADGKSDVAEHKAGDVAWAGPAKHKEENLGDKAFEVVVVELK
jgi:uncharacterized RmlC-like cupin family protein